MWKYFPNVSVNGNFKKSEIFFFSNQVFREWQQELLVRFCIGFFGNWARGPRTGDWVHPRVADRGVLAPRDSAEYGYKLNKQSQTIFQGWSRSNILQAKVLMTLLRAAWLHRVVSFMVSPGNPFASWSIQTLPLHAGLCKGGPYTSLADCENNIEKNDLNKSMCKELIGGKSNLTKWASQSREVEWNALVGNF